MKLEVFESCVASDCKRIKAVQNAFINTVVIIISSSKPSLKDINLAGLS